MVFDPNFGNARLKLWLRKFAPALLGSWHPGKHLAEVTYRTFLATLIAPMIHAIYPTSSILKKPRYGVIMHLFVLLHYAYARSKTYISRVLSDSSLTVAQRVRLRNFQVLFEFFVPVCIKYALGIRSKSETAFEEAQKFLCLALLLLGSNTYFRAVVLSMSLCRYWKRVIHPIRDVLSDPSHYNEEVGEISLSNLSQSLVRQTQKYLSAEETSKQYKKVGLARLVSLELNEDLGFKTDSAFKERRGSVNPDDPRVSKLAQKLIELIDQAKGNWAQYPPLSGNNHFYPALEKVVPVASIPTKPIFNENVDIGELVTQQIAKLNALFSPPARPLDHSESESESAEARELPDDYAILSHDIRAGTHWYRVSSDIGVTEYAEEELDETKVDEYWESIGYQMPENIDELDEAANDNYEY